MVVKLKKSYLLSILLAIYSLLPAIAKLTGNTLFFALYIPILILLYLIFRNNKIKLTWLDIPFMLFFLMAIICIPVSVGILQTASLTTLLYGSVMFLIPMTGYFFSRLIPIDMFISSVIFVGFIHTAIGILFYGFIPLPAFLDEIKNIVSEGVMAFRMSSVSGSLVLGALVIVTLAFSIIRSLMLSNRHQVFFVPLFLFVAIMTMQRSAWVAAVLIVILTIIYILANHHKVVKSNVYILQLEIFIFAVFCIVTMSNFDTLISFMLEHLKSIFQGDAIKERYSLWLGGIYNFLKIPIGIGIGTVGQAARVSGFTSKYHYVPDGDYFRILSEIGFPALVFYMFLFWRLILKTIKMYKLSSSSFAIYLALIALSINMIGSNTTEFYFVNFVYWVCVGYFFTKDYQRVRK